MKCASFFSLLNLVQLERRSLTEWIQLAKLIWVGLNSDLIRLMWSTVSEPGLTPTTLASFEITNLDQATYITSDLLWLTLHTISWSGSIHLESLPLQKYEETFDFTRNLKLQ